MRTLTNPSTPILPHREQTRLPEFHEVPQTFRSLFFFVASNKEGKPKETLSECSLGWLDLAYYFFSILCYTRKFWQVIPCPKLLPLEAQNFRPALWRLESGHASPGWVRTGTRCTAAAAACAYARVITGSCLGSSGIALPDLTSQAPIKLPLPAGCSD